MYGTKHSDSEFLWVMPPYSLQLIVTFGEFCHSLSRFVVAQGA